MSFNPATCPIGSKYYYQHLGEDAPTPPTGWTLDISNGSNMTSIFNTSGWDVSALSADSTEKHTLIGSEEIEIDLTKRWIFRTLMHVPLYTYAQMRVLSFSVGIRCNGSEYGYYFRGGLYGPVPPNAVNDGDDFDIIMEKYELGSTGSCRLTINGVILQDRVTESLFAWGVIPNIHCTSSPNQAIGNWSNASLLYTYLIHEDLSTPCLGNILVDASASKSRGVAPLGVQFNDQTEIV